MYLSVGAAPNKLIAKIASDLDKPRGFSVLGHEAQYLGRAVLARGEGRVVAALGAAAGINIIYDPQLKNDRFTLDLRGMTFQKALETAKAATL